MLFKVAKLIQSYVCMVLLQFSKVFIDSFQAFGERKFGELIDQPIGYQF